MMTSFTTCCTFGGVFLRCVSQYIVSVLTVCTFPRKTAAYIDFDSALNVVSERIKVSYSRCTVQM